jgi:hypothetical protein
MKKQSGDSASTAGRSGQRRIIKVSSTSGGNRLLARPYITNGDISWGVRARGAGVGRDPWQTTTVVGIRLATPRATGEPG